MMTSSTRDARSSVILLFSVLLLSSICSSVRAFAEPGVPRFDQYPVHERFAGRNAPLVLRSHEDRLFRNMLRRAAHEKPNFAGHYVVDTWGCGAGCVMGAVIDARKGFVHWFPHTVCCWSGTFDDNFEPVEYRRQSRLLVFVGARNEKEGDEGKHYYKFADGQFQLIRSILGKVP